MSFPSAGFCTSEKEAGIAGAAFGSSENDMSFANTNVEPNAISLARLRASIGAIAAKSGVPVNPKLAWVGQLYPSFVIDNCKGLSLLPMCRSTEHLCLKTRSVTKAFCFI